MRIRFRKKITLIASVFFNQRPTQYFLSIAYFHDDEFNLLCENACIVYNSIIYFSSTWNPIFDAAKR